MKLQIDQVKQALEEAHTLEMTKLVDRRQAESEFAQAEIFRLKAELLNAQVARNFSSFLINFQMNTLFFFLHAFLALFWTGAP